MRPFEIMLVVLIAIYLFSLFLGKARRNSLLNWISIGLLVITAVHILFEGMRWQMFIAYLFAVAIMLKALMSNAWNNEVNNNDKPQKKSRRIILSLVATFGLIALGLNVALASLLSIPKMPTPTGPYEVGTTFLHLIDIEREETATVDSTDMRSLWVQAWYPAEQTKSFERMPVLPKSEKWMVGMLHNLGLPKFVPQHWSLIKSHSYLDAPINSGEQAFPIILFSHAYHGFLSHNTQQFEALASNGYVVFSIAHSYNTQLGLKQDGSWLTLEDPNTIKFSRIDTTIFNNAARASRQIRINTETPENLTTEDRKTLDSLHQVMYKQYHDQLKIRAADMSFVLDEAERMQSGKVESQFKGKLNLNQVGAFGGSLGGPSALLFNAIDPRCLASANIDGAQFGALFKFELNKPHLIFFNGKDGKNDGFSLRDWETINNANPYYKIVIEGAGHGNIVDMVGNPILARRLGLGVGPIEPKLVYKIYNSYLLAFFDEHVKGEEQTSLEGKSTFTMVEFKKY